VTPGSSLSGCQTRTVQLPQSVSVQGAFVVGEDEVLPAPRAQLPDDQVVAQRCPQRRRARRTIRFLASDQLGRRGSSARKGGSAPGRGATRRQAPHEHRSGQETRNNSATRGKIEPGPLFIHLPPPPPARTGTARPAAPATPVCPSFAGHPYDPQEDGWSATPNEVRREVQTRPAASAEAASRAGAGAGGCRERPHPVRGPLERPLESVVHAASSVSYDDPVASQRSGPAKRSETHDSARVIEMRRLR
jgi:hypothetical protein